MPELIIAFVLGVLLPSVAVYLVDRRRRGAWDAESVARGRVLALEEVARLEDARVAAEAELAESEHTEALEAQRTDAAKEVVYVRGVHLQAAEEAEAAHVAAVVALETDHMAASDTSQRAIVGLQGSLSKARGEIDGLNAAHAETKRWADKILRDHEWHIGGKADPHAKGTLLRYECACGAVTHAEEGAL